MDPMLESLLDAEAPRMDEALKRLERLLRPKRKSDSVIDLPALADAREREERDR